MLDLIIDDLLLSYFLQRHQKGGLLMDCKQIAYTFYESKKIKIIWKILQDKITQISATANNTKDQASR